MPREGEYVVLTTRGAKTGKVRKIPLTRVEHEGRYAAVASKGGFPQHPVWYFNVTADPHVELQDGAARLAMMGREVTGAGRRRVSGVRRVPGENRPRDPVFILEPRPAAS